MASGLQSQVQDHSNITMFIFIAYPIFFEKQKTKKKTRQNTIILTPNTPPKTIKGKNSLLLSPSHLKEHNCLSLIQLKEEKKKTKEKHSKKKKKLEVLVISKWTAGEKYLPTSMAVNEKSGKPRPLLHHTANVSCILIMHRSE